MSTQITEEEKLALRFYLGDPAVAADGPYRGGPQAYNTINALLHPGFSNEMDKAAEGRQVVLEDAQQMESFLHLTVLIFSAMEKYRRQQKGRGNAAGWRVDRLSSLQQFVQDEGRIAGFFSCSREGLMPAYAHIKKNIVLLEVLAEEDAPYVDIADLLQSFYAKPEEAEVLFPPGTVICSMQALPISPREQEEYADLDGKPPAGKYRLHLARGTYPAVPEEELEQLLHDIAAQEGKAAQIMADIMRGRRPKPEDAVFYGEWKTEIRRYVGGYCHKILMQQE